MEALTPSKFTPTQASAPLQVPLMLIEPFTPALTEPVTLATLGPARIPALIETPIEPLPPPS